MSTELKMSPEGEFVAESFTSLYTPDVTYIGLTGSDVLCPNQKCIVKRHSGIGGLYTEFPCLCHLTWPSKENIDRRSQETTPSVNDFTTEQLVDALLNKGYKVTLTRG